VQEKEEVTSTLAREHSELTSRVTDLNVHEATMEAEQERLSNERVDLLNHELVVSFKEDNLASKEKELADMEKRLVEKQLQELVAVRMMWEELQAARAAKVQKV
jgi:hypothetical protein